MVQLVCGHSGTGKTRRMIEMANNAIDKIHGSMVFGSKQQTHIRFRLQDKVY